VAHREGRPQPEAEGESQDHYRQDEGYRREEAELSEPAGPVLGIETATSQGGVAVAAGGEVLGELQIRNPRSHSERLLPAVETLLGAAGLEPASLAAIAVSIGPGSFTGLRIGVAAAKGLAFSLDLPLYGLPTLEVLAANAGPAAATVCAVIDARRGEVFTALYRRRGSNLVKSRKERILAPDKLAASLPGGTVLCGEPPPSLRSALSRKGSDIVLAPPELAYPRAAVVALRGMEALVEGRAAEGPGLTPFYLRPSDAESNRKRGKSRKN